MKRDAIKRIICDELNLRAYTAQTLTAVREITRLHKTSPNASTALGRTVTATALLSATLKPDSLQNITLKFSGSGPIGEVHVQADAKGHVRGYVENPDVDLTEDIGEISFSKTIGAGFLTLTKDLGLREPYSSVMPLYRGEVAEDVAYYLTVSEQVPSALLIAFELEKDAGISVSEGILIQAYPDTDEEVLARVEQNIMNTDISMTDFLKNGGENTGFLSRLFDDVPFRVLDEYPLVHSCRCSRELISTALQSMEREHLEEMIEKDRGAEIVCSFCKNKYLFSENDLKEMLGDGGDSA